MIFGLMCSHGDRHYLLDSLFTSREQAGVPVHWLVVLSAPSPALRELGRRALSDGLADEVLVFNENRGQHWAMNEGLRRARDGGFEWFHRQDDDVRPQTPRYLAKMIDRCLWLQRAAGDPKRRIVAAPRVTGLRNPLRSIQRLRLPGQKWPCDVMQRLGGACRLHPMELFADFKPDLYAPVGRMDPESVENFVIPPVGDPIGIMVRFPDIVVTHNTNRLEADDSAEQQIIRRMSKVWCWLGEGA